MSEIDDLAVEQRNGPDPIEAAEQLAVIFDLPSVGLEVRGGRIVGGGMAATAYVFLSDGTTLTFETLRDFITPTKLMGELALHTRTTPQIKQSQAIRALACLSALAEHQRTATMDQLSVEWGMTFLQRATPFDVDMRDQAQRWSAFKHIEEVDRGIEREHRQFARSVVALVDVDGTRYVRTGWFREHVREEDRSVSPQEIAQRMERVGWRRRGRSEAGRRPEGKIKATEPGFGRQLIWAFYLVPQGWEEMRWVDEESDE